MLYAVAGSVIVFYEKRGVSVLILAVIVCNETLLSPPSYLSTFNYSHVYFHVYSSVES